MSRIIPVSLFLLLASCVGSSDSGPPPASPEAVESSPAPAESNASGMSAETAKQSVEPRVLAALAAADAKDGAVDQVVTKCSGCSLMMNGKPEHSLQVGDYELHLCSGACKDYFNKDLAGSLEQLAALVEPSAVKNPTAD